MRVRAFAKINLSLRVLATRADGYHELRTVFQSIALHDTLTIRRIKGPFRLTCDHRDCPSDATNLVWRAAERVWRAAGRRGAPRDVVVGLEKRIPVNAGLGGGSSDCAAALRAFGRMWRVEGVGLRAIARELGADVPYFFEGGTVLGLERGDLLYPLLDRPASWVTLVFPDFGVSTRDAFGWFDREGKKGSDLDLSTSSAHASAKGTDQDLTLYSTNDLEPAVAGRFPEIRRLVLGLRRADAFQAAMSGSGSTVFGLFESRRTALRAAASLAAKNRRTLVTRTLNRLTYQRLAGM